VPDARDGAEELATRTVVPSWGDRGPDPEDPVGWLRGNKPKPSRCHQGHLLTPPRNGRQTAGSFKPSTANVSMLQSGPSVPAQRVAGHGTQQWRVPPATAHHHRPQRYQVVLPAGWGARCPGPVAG
jgi:hypothetical protein